MKVHQTDFSKGKCISEYSGGLDSDDVGTASEPVVQCCRPYVYWKDSGSRGNSTAGELSSLSVNPMITAFNISDIVVGCISSVLITDVIKQESSDIRRGRFIKETAVKRLISK